MREDGSYAGIITTTTIRIISMNYTFKLFLVISFSPLFFS